MADSKKVKRITRGKMRLVAKSKWELPIQGSKSYWSQVCEGIESKVIRVRNPSTPPPALYPGAPSSIRSSASSASSGDINVYDFTKRHLAAEVVDASAAEPIVKIYPPSPPSRDSTTDNTSGLPRTVKFQSNCEEESNDPMAPLESHRRIRKLSKMTKLVNDFLSSTRTRVRPSSAKSSMSPLRKRESGETRKAGLTGGKSIVDPSKDDASRKFSIVTMTPQESKEKTPCITEEGRLKKRSVIFREDIEEIVERFDPNEDIANAKPRRPRAPSLSVASAVPSFGRVVISIESISSIEDDEEHGKAKTVVDHTSSPVSRDRAESTKNLSKVDGQRVTQVFLKVPEIRTVASSSYPGHDTSTSQQQGSPNKIQTRSTRTDEAFKAKLMMESKALRKKCALWPSRSLVHVFRALKAMKRGTRSKARIESETNRFFAAPLEIYSPSARSSISSDERTDLIESRSGHNDEYGECEGSEDNVDEESESSYASVRERLMRNAGAHIGKDFQRATATCIDEDKTLEATSEPTYSSSFYNSRYSAADKLKVKHRSKKTSAAARFISVPRMARIFPRIKTDKCLACMCQSLEEINQSARQQTAARFSNENNEMLLFEKAPTEPSCFQYSRRTSYDQSCGLPEFGDGSREKFLGDEHPGRRLNSGFAGTNIESTEVEIYLAQTPESGIGSLTRSSTQLEVSPQSRVVGKAMPKALVAAKSVISSLSMASERSKSISDQDDSDQGCIETGGNDAGLGGNATSKNLAPCHMPINLKPSLEPLKALRHKKSRSIRSRVASAEKSTGSGTDDNDSDDDDKNRRLPVNIANIKLEENHATNKAGLDETTGSESQQSTHAKPNGEADKSHSINGSKETEDNMGGISSKSDPDDANNLKKFADDFYDEVVISDQEVINIATRCLNENKTVAETLKVLAEEYTNRLPEAFSSYNRSPNFRKNEKIAKKLLTLLVDSKSYLNRGKWPNETTHLSFSSKQPPLCNSRQLRRVLPLKSYNLVAPILGMAKWYPKRRTSGILASSKVNTRHKEPGGKVFDLIVHPPSRMAHRVSFEPDDTRPKLSPYALFLTKPRRKVITWRPLTERDLEGYDPEATLKMRAARITDRICEDFCQWLRSLAAGTNQASGIDVEVLKDMFETDFTAEVCRTMQVSINEMSMVPDAVAAARKCPDAGQLALTRRHLIKDAKAEIQPKRTVGFGTALPNNLKFLPPRNSVDEKWLQCENVPTDLETMDAVWKDITHLTSVKGFIDWLKAHPRVSRPKALKKVLAMKGTAVTRESQEIDGFKELELDLDQIQSLKVGDNDPDGV